MDGYGAIRSRSDRIITSSCISCSLGACFLGFARFTHSLQYIYTRWSLNACSCSLHTLSPSPDLNKTSLASVSPHCCSKSWQDPSARKGRSLNVVAVGKGRNPLPAQLFTFTQRRRGRASDPFFFTAVHSVGRIASVRPPNHTPRTLRYNLLIPHALL